MRSGSDHRNPPGRSRPLLGLDDDIHVLIERGRARLPVRSRHAATFNLSSTRPKVTTGLTFRPWPFSSRTKPYRSIVRSVRERLLFARPLSVASASIEFRSPLRDEREQRTVLVR